MTLREGVRMMASEGAFGGFDPALGAPSPGHLRPSLWQLAPLLCSGALRRPSMTCHGVRAGSLKTWFRGNGTNVLKIAPETSMKLALNDHLRHRICADDPPTALERLCFGGISGAVAQVRAKQAQAS
jgi:hypothetical protein